MGFLNRYRELPHDGQELDHIAENLRHLFNTRRGYGSPLHDYGVGQPDPHADTVGASSQVLRELLGDVLRYEKRIEYPVMTTHGRSPDLELLIELRGRVNGQPVLFKLRYHQIHGGVRVEVGHVD
jgi:predicted component of type VI protein secretion system